MPSVITELQVPFIGRNLIHSSLISYNDTQLWIDNSARNLKETLAKHIY